MTVVPTVLQSAAIGARSGAFIAGCVCTLVGTPYIAVEIIAPVINKIAQGVLSIFKPHHEGYKKTISYSDLTVNIARAVGIIASCVVLGAFCGGVYGAITKAKALVL